jgi:hypothetical protein
MVRAAGAFLARRLVITTSPALAKVPQGHSAAAFAAFRSVANPVVDAFA